MNTKTKTWLMSKYSLWENTDFFGVHFAVRKSIKNTTEHGRGNKAQWQKIITIITMMMKLLFEHCFTLDRMTGWRNSARGHRDWLSLLGPGQPRTSAAAGRPRCDNLEDGGGGGRTETPGSPAAAAA